MVGLQADLDGDRDGGLPGPQRGTGIVAARLRVGSRRKGRIIMTSIEARVCQ